MARWWRMLRPAIRFDALLFVLVFGGLALALRGEMAGYRGLAGVGAVLASVAIFVGRMTGRIY